MGIEELIENIGYEKIFEDTKISPENVRKIKDREWENLNKVQALGFISILEKRYKIDLSKLKAEVKAFYQEKEKEEKPIYVTPTDRALEKESGGFLGKIALIAFLLALGYGGWYFFIEKNQDINSTKESNATNEGFLDSIINKAKEWSGSNKKDEVKEKIDNKKVEVKEEKVEVKKEDISKNISNQEASAKEEARPKKFDITSMNQNNLNNRENLQEDNLQNKETKNEENISNNLEEENIKENSSQAQAAQITKEENSFVDNNEDKLEELDQNGEENNKITQDNNINEVKKEENIIEDLTPKNKDNEENRTNQDINLEDSLAASPNKSEENLTNSVVNEEKNKVQKSIVEIGSKYKLWIGYINLNNFKRKSEIISKPKKFEVTNKGILLVTGHGKFYIKNGDKNLRYKDRKKHYFYFHDGKVEEVGRKKFRELAKSKVW